MRNGEYSILKSFAKLEKTPGVPGLGLPGLDIGYLAMGFGCRTVNVDTVEKLADEFTAALKADGPTVIVVPTKPQAVHLGWWSRSHEPTLHLERHAQFCGIPWARKG
jgi:benzoylformate decarboxylase